VNFGSSLSAKDFAREEEMNNGPILDSTRAILAILLAATTASAMAAGSVEILHSFGEDDGEYPASEIVVDGAGNLYGTTTEGGDFNAGIVFQLSPDGAGGYTETILHHFNGFADGLNPYGGVAIDADGNLYGTTTAGGTGGVCAEDGCGVVYKLTKNGGSWDFSVLHHFTGGFDGWGVGGQPALDAAGNVYGTTPNGGLFGIGVVWQLVLDAGEYRFRVLHHFTGGEDGATGGLGRVLVLPNGRTLFGVATVGGANGAGVAYQMKQDDLGNWTFRTLYAFQGAPAAGFPYGGLTMDDQGNLYGTTYYDGAEGYGTVYRLSRDGGAGWIETVLHSFTGGANGNNPSTNLAFDARGNLYGTTAEGGARGCHCGTIFRLTPDGAGGWTHRVVYRFKGSPDGSYSYYSIVPDRRGNWYGATVHGGEDGDGTVFRFTP
jgi:uncharacterized repeat protein (TIGR03803 family)